MGSWYCHGKDVITVTLHVQPGAKHSEIIGLHGESLKIRLASPPVEGRANEALVKFLASIFAVPLCNVKLLQGEKSRRKVVAISNSLVDPQYLLDDSA